LPSIIPSYVYTLFASIIVGTLVISMVGLSVANVKSESEGQQLSNIAEYVAVKSLQLTSSSQAGNLTSTTRLDIPSLVGNQRYWIKIQNDSIRAWVEAGFGDAALSSDKRAYIPADLAASGTYVSGSATAYLQYVSGGAGAQLTLYGGE